LTRLSCGGPDVIARPKAVAISYSLCSYALVLWSLPAFAERNGSQAAAQIKAFEDTWHWDKISAAAYQEVVETGHAHGGWPMK
jgi:hypothetical protein